MTPPTWSDLFSDLAEQAPRIDVGAAAVDRAERARRRNRMVASAVIAVVGVTAGVSFLLSASDSSNSRPSADASADKEIRTVTPAQQSGLQWRVTGLPWHLVLRPQVDRLSAEPVQSAAAVLAPYQRDGAVSDVYVYGTDGRLRRADRLHLSMNDGGNGRPSSPVRVSSLSPDGRFAAFPQRDSLVVLNVASGRARSYPVPGKNTDVVWTGDSRRVLVGGDAGSTLVDLSFGVRLRLPLVRVSDTAFTAANTMVRWTIDPAGASHVSTSGPTGDGGASAVLHDPGSPLGAPIATGSVAARMVSASGGGTAARIVDRNNGATLAELHFPSSTVPPAEAARGCHECCQVLGWDGDVLLVSSRYADGVRILRWDWRKSELTRSMEVAGPAVVSLSRLS